MASFEHNADMSVDQVDKKPKQEHAHGHSHSHGEGHEFAKIVALGTVTVGGATFTIDREGQVECGKETEFGVELIGGANVKPSAAWLANPDGSEVCDKVSSEDHNQHWHFKVDPLDPVKKSKFVLQVGEETAVLDFARGAQPCNTGILSVVKAPHAPEWRGYLELKLHGDAGDLELWLYDPSTTMDEFARSKPTPFDIPKETVLTLTFPTHGGKSITMAVRDMDKNEDEEGTPNMRGDGTNYFIFPGESGQDPAWLVGETPTSWRGLVTVTFQVDGKSYVAEPFVLVPHDALEG